MSRHVIYRRYRPYLFALVATAMALPAFSAFSASTAPVASATPAPDQSAPVYGFDSSLLWGSSSSLERFNRANAFDPGAYQVDIYVNDNFRGRKSVEFRAAEGGVFPCLDDDFLIASGVVAGSISPDERASEQQAAQKNDAAGRNCRPLERRIAGASSTLDFSRLRLNISIPQSLMSRVPRGFVNVGDLDAGETMAFFNYDASHYRSTAAGRTSDFSYLGLNSGVNMGLWRFRQQSSYRYTTGTGDSGGHWNSIRAYAQRALPDIQSELTVGDSYTSGSLFSGVGFRGFQIGTDERMLPDSQHGYAPVVRGVAQTNARVVIRQGGNEIYQTTVPPGPFLIQDLYSTSYQGDLQVEVREADGRISTFTVPFSAVPDSMRPGASRYNVTAGRVRDVPDSRAVFTDITYQRGLSNALTGNIGARLAKDYQSFLLGAVTGTPIGAFGANITYSTTKAFDGTRISGGLASLTYSHTFQPTSTTFSLAGYRYSTRGYRDLVDALGERAAAERGGTWSSSTFQQRNQLVANISQSFGSYGQVYLSASASDYYNTQSRDTRMQFGYSNSYKSLSYNLSFARQRTVPFDNTRPDLMSQGTSFGREGRTENIVMLSLSMPFGTGPRSASISGGVTRSARGASYQTSVSGMADEAQTLSYGASVSREAEGGSNLSVNAQKNLAATTIGGSFSQGSGYSQVSANARGAAVVHSGGLTLGPYLGETFGLIEAKGASGAGVRNGTGARIDDSGYALIPSLTAYRYNSVALDSQGIGRNVELDGNQQRVAPYAGAAVKLRFATRTGYALLVKAALLDGSALPLGADVYDNTGAGIGMVGQGGQVYARVGEKQGWLTVKWGKSRQEQCTINYDLSESDMSLALHRVAARCLPIGVIATNRAEPAAPQLE